MGLDPDTTIITLNFKGIECPLKFLIDSGADISLIKLNKLNPEMIVQTDDKTIVTGLTGKEEYTLGSWDGTILLDKKEITHQFHASIFKFDSRWYFR